MNYTYTYDVDEIDKILENLQKGIQPAMTNPELEKDLEMRLKEHQESIDDDDELPFAVSDTDRIANKIQSNKRKASKSGGIIITISDTQKQLVKGEMEQSIVRNDPESTYNETDESLYSSAEKRIIFQRLNGLRNIYHTQKDFQNAIHIINDAIEYAIKHEFPMYPEKEVRKMFNEGKIKYKRPIPKLYLNYINEITDKDILKGIVTGEVTIIDKKKTEKKKTSRKECLCDKTKTIHNCEMMKKKLALKEKLFEMDDTESEDYKYTLSKLSFTECQKDKCKNFGIKTAKMEYDIIGPNENYELVQLHRQGYETPISPSIRMKSGIYNQYALPSSNLFSTNNSIHNQKENRAITHFDWTQPNAGVKYYNLLHGKKYTTNEFINDLSKDNKDQLTNEFRSNMYNLLSKLKYANSGDNGLNEYQRDEHYISSSLQVDDETLIIERDILAAMKNYNPNL